MENTKLFTVLRFIIFSAILTFLLGCPSRQEPTRTNQTAPDFSLKTIDGEDISLNSYRDKKVVHLVFWATWCPSCLMEIPKLKKLHEAIGDKPYEIVSIDVGVNDSVKKVRQVQERYQLSYKMLFDEAGEVSRKYGIMGVPTHFIINKEGVIINQFNQLPENTTAYLAQFFPS
jgi:peroxiredoxin